jgi:filamentous hemagglutinin family protein
MSAALCAAGLSSPAVLAGPTDGRVVAGTAEIRTNGRQTDILQSSDRTVIDWRSFSIDAGEAVYFRQTPTQAALNRVTGDQASRIHGTLAGNGTVILLNPNGILFGPTARVDVGSFVASTSQLSNDSFMSGGKLEFTAPATLGGSIVNQGTISARDGGLVALVAPHVRNDGLIWARLGRVVLGSGSSFELDLTGDRLVSFKVRDADLEQLSDVNGNRVGARIEHGGSTLADGGKIVVVSAQAAKDVVDQAINLRGLLRADTVGRDARGQIVLEAHGGRVALGGELLAMGREAGQAGGTISILADAIAFTREQANGGPVLARIDASAVDGPAGKLALQYGKDASLVGNTADAISATLRNGTDVAVDATVRQDTAVGPGMIEVRSRIDGRPVGATDATKASGDLSLTGARVVVANDIYTHNGAIRLRASTGDVSMIKPQSGELAPGRDTPVLFAGNADIELTAQTNVVAHYLVTRGDVRVTSEAGNVEFQKRLGRDFDGAYPLRSLTVRALGTPADDTKVKEVGNVNALRDVMVAPGGTIDIRATRNIRLIEGPDNGRADSPRAGIVAAKKGEGGRTLVMRSERLGDSGNANDPNRLGDLANDPFYWTGINSRISHIGPDKNPARADGRWTDLSKTVKDSDNPSLTPPSPVRVLGDTQSLATIAPVSPPKAPELVAMAPELPAGASVAAGSPIAAPSVGEPAGTITPGPTTGGGATAEITAIQPAAPSNVSDATRRRADDGATVEGGEEGGGYSGGRGVAQVADTGRSRNPAAPRDVFAAQEHVVEVRDCEAPITTGNAYFGTGAFGQMLSVGCR